MLGIWTADRASCCESKPFCSCLLGLNLKSVLLNSANARVLSPTPAYANIRTYIQSGPVNRFPPCSDHSSIPFVDQLPITIVYPSIHSIQYPKQSAINTRNSSKRCNKVSESITPGYPILQKLPSTRTGVIRLPAQVFAVRIMGISSMVLVLYMHCHEYESGGRRRLLPVLALSNRSPSNVGRQPRINPVLGSHHKTQRSPSCVL